MVSVETKEKIWLLANRWASKNTAIACTAGRRQKVLQCASLTTKFAYQENERCL